MLTNKTEISVRFNEIDVMGILWHGHYIKYFEDGRESFGREYHLGYMDMHEQGYMVPIVKVDCNYKRPIRYKDDVVIETRFVDSPAAKIIFEYTLFNKNTGETFATGRSTQVFLDNNQQLSLTLPEFFVAWKKQWGLLS